LDFQTHHIVISRVLEYIFNMWILSINNNWQSLLTVFLTVARVIVKGRPRERPFNCLYLKHGQSTILHLWVVEITAIKDGKGAEIIIPPPHALQLNCMHGLCRNERKWIIVNLLR
jgi:hypothetical protein